VVSNLDQEPFATSAFSSAANSQSGVFANNSWASASQGVIHLFSTSNESASTAFVGTVADAGWNDTVTITGGTGNGLWNVQIFVHGELTADGGYASSAQLQVTAYKNQNRLGQTPGFYTANDSWCSQFVAPQCQWYGATEYSSIGYQDVVFSAYNADTGSNTYPIPTTDKDVLINQVVTFQIPFTYGVSFELGIWADSFAGVGSSGAHPTDSTANIGNTLYWGGSTVLQADGSGTPSTNFTATGLGGFDYNVAITPEPGCLVLTALALGLAVALGMRRA
jgi:hypothetical protein